MNNEELSPQYLMECLEYDREQGSLTWKVRPLEHFTSPRQHYLVNKAKAGKSAVKVSRGTASVHFFGKYVYLGARVVWCLVTGQYPSRKMITRNGDLSDLRWENLALG